jgi:ATP-dependent Lon protease
VTVSDETLRLVVDEYTREAGVRNLERELGTVLRKTATKIASAKAEAPVEIGIDEVREALGRQRFFQDAAMRTAVPGVATGLAVTGVGGDVLFVEATAMKGKENLVLTGQLGDVMKESARAAFTYATNNAAKLGIAKDRLGAIEAHIHVPAGAIPKDGPSAGIAIATALVSEMSDRPVRRDVAMTGEITLRGRVLPIGGLKEKVLGAHRAGIKVIVLPKENEADIEDIPEEVRSQLSFHAVETLEEVLKIALVPEKDAEASEEKKEAMAAA